jgi:hypothetical protein
MIKTIKNHGPPLIGRYDALRASMMFLRDSVLQVRPLEAMINRVPLADFQFSKLFLRHVSAP